MKITPKFFKRRAPEKVYATWHTWSSDLTDVVGLTISTDEQALKIEMSKYEAKSLGNQLSGIRKYVEEAIQEAAVKRQEAIKQAAGDIVGPDYWLNQGKYEALVEVSLYLGLRK